MAATGTGPRSPGGVDPERGSLPGGALALVLTWDADARCTSARADGSPNGALVATSLCGDGWLDALHPEDRMPALDWVRSVVRGSAAREETVRLAGGDRWAIVRIRAGDGNPAGVAARGVVVDATRSLGAPARMARLVEGFNSLSHPLDIVAAMLDDGVAMVGGRTAVLHVLSDSGDELKVAGSAGLPEGALEEQFGRIPLSSSLPAAEVMRTGRPVVVRSEAERIERYPELEGMAINYDPAFVVVPLNDAEGRPFGAMGIGFPGEVDITDEDYDFLRDVAGQCAVALDRARLAAAAERSQGHLGFLDELSAALSSSLQIDTALSQLAGLTVPRIADWCVVRMTESASDPRPLVGVAHVDRSAVGRLTELAQRFPRDLARVGELGAALKAGRPLIRAKRGMAMLIPRFEDVADGAELARLAEGGVAVFPLQARGRLLGALAFGNRPGRSFSDADIELAKAVASRAAVIVDNARLFHERSGVARALQDSLLPPRLPDIPGIDLGARYRAAGQGLDVGGDFYDAFEADANWWMFAVGDVCGHGVEAAATTGLVRHTLRSAAMHGVMPSAVLGHLNKMLLRAGAERDAVDDGRVPVSPRFCTALVGAVQPTSRGVDIILCSGGHPLPLVRRAAGRVHPVGVPGTLLGVTDDVILTDSVVHLDPGEALVCYTDGLIDRRSGRRAFGEEGIVKAMYQGQNLGAHDLAVLIESEAVSFVDVAPADDMAVLALVADQSR
jgi:serine phosphatase RsbU (regulator of sigma subunit)